MKNKFLLLFSVIILIISFKVEAQEDTLNFNAPLRRLQHLGDSLLRGSSDSLRINSHEQFSILLDSILQNPVSRSLSFYQTNTLSVITSPDEKIRIYNWMLPLKDGNSYRYFGYVQILDEKKKQVKLYRLAEKKQVKNEEAEVLKLDTTSWYGCIYYKIIQEKVKRKKFYLLLGWAPNTSSTTRKIIEPLLIYPNKIGFGAPILKTGGRPKQRMIFEYNSSVSMSLRYDDKMKMIVFDHLASSDPRPESKGMYSVYGPDLTYDGFKFKKGYWYFFRDVDIRNDAKDTGKTPELKKFRVTKGDRKRQ